MVDNPQCCSNLKSKAGCAHLRLVQRSATTNSGPHCRAITRSKHALKGSRHSPGGLYSQARTFPMSFTVREHSLPAISPETSNYPSTTGSPGPMSTYIMALLRVGPPPSCKAIQLGAKLIMVDGHSCEQRLVNSLLMSLPRNPHRRRPHLRSCCQTPTAWHKRGSACQIHQARTANGH